MEPFEQLKQMINEGVAYDSKHGAICPLCGSKNIYIIRTLQPDNNGQVVREHLCKTLSCRFATYKTIIRSIEDDNDISK